MAERDDDILTRTEDRRLSGEHSDDLVDEKLTAERSDDYLGDLVRTIRLRNVRVNNLKNISLDIPHGQWLAVCGLSGSGKSSLAFDTLYAEGQRRYIDCLSPGTRKFLTQLDKPDADLIDGLPPAIAVRAMRGTPDRRTTVSNATEIVEHLRLLFARAGNIVCPICQTDVMRQDAQSVAGWLEQLPQGTRYMLGFNHHADDAPGAMAGEQGISGGTERLTEALLSGRRNGFLRAVLGERLINLESMPDLLPSDDDVRPLFVVDRLTTGGSERSRILESLETAFQFGDGQCEVLIAKFDSTQSEQSNGAKSGRNENPNSLSSNRANFQTRTIDNRTFQQTSFSSKLICPRCCRLFPDPEPKLFSFNKPTSACPNCDGVGFDDLDYQSVCTTCHGDRLLPDGLAFRIGDQNIADICRLTVDQADEFFQNLNFGLDRRSIAQPLLKQIQTRLDYLHRVGLGYLTLDRPVRTLSGGEAQRVALTSCLSSTLVNMLYVLDEPTIGLHPHDVGRLITAVEKLHARGNTLVIVDHEAEMIRAAERVIEIGPAAGSAGGDIVFDGTADELSIATTITGDHLAGRRGVSSGAGNRRKPRGRLQLKEACGHNLKSIDVEFPLGCLCLVSGVSGAGKSSLVQQTLYGAIGQRQQDKKATALSYKELFGETQIDEVVLVDQSPIGRSSRSNPVTYVKAFDDIRKAFAETVDAKTRKFKAGHFSFNVAGGRCDKCSGDGQLTIDMQFLPDVYIRCDACNGTRFRDETLAVRYRGRNIAEVLDLTVREAFAFFRGQPKVQGKLKALIDVGLEYIRLGQPATTLSAGESQRLKLAVYLNASKKKRVLFLLEEPTTGLHAADVIKLIDCFDALLMVGHSLIIVEHNLQLMKYADWIIDLGPGAGDAGGQVVVSGTPEIVASHPDSITGQYLKVELDKCKMA